MGSLNRSPKNRMVANGVTATGLAWGPNKGHVVEPLPKRVKPSTKRTLGVKVKLARDVVREVCGFAPYEKRAMELLSQGFDKRALKFCKKRLGTHRRGKKKRSELENIMQAEAQGQVNTHSGCYNG